MGLKNRIVFGVHSITPYNQTDKKPYGILKVLGGANLELTGESEDLFGGSSKFAYASEATQIASQMTCNTKSYPNFLMELFLGGQVTSVAASATGEVRNYVNGKGSSLKHATTGVAAVAVKSGGGPDLKWGRYVFVAASATTVDVYAITDIDFGRGTSKIYLDDSLKVASALAVVSGDETEVVGFGLELSGGSGTIAMVVGDTAIFDVYPPNSGASIIEVGSAVAQFPAFGAFMLANKNGQKEIFQIEAYNCIGSGMPIPMQEKAFMVSDLTVKLLRDESKDSVFNITSIQEV